MKKNLNGGFIGLLVLLISVAIIAYLMSKELSTITGTTGGSNNPDDIQEGSGIPAINAAKNAKAQIEQNSAKENQQLQ
ncbi:MAG: hypothetical protein V4486_01190 [Patescibacteria group bacterium]